MDCFYDLKKVPNIKNSILTIGTFDGLHLGHQKILNKITQESKKLNKKSVLITFDPKPGTFLFNKKNDTLIPNLIKIKKIERIGIDILLILKFDEKLSNLEADDFLYKFIYKKFKPDKIIIGFNHEFGKNRKGDAEYLIKKSIDYNYKIDVLPKYKKKNTIISSTLIRKKILNGDVNDASSIIGNNYNFYVKREIGSGIGKSIGFPTINFQNLFKNQIIPKKGVYFTKIKFYKKFEEFEFEEFHSMTNIGFRPTFNKNNFQMETHILSKKFIDNNQSNFNIEFIKRIRNEIKFSSSENLIKQLKKDKNYCLSLL